MALGDHFFVWRRQYGIGRFQHHGIDVGDGTVVHFTDGKDGVAGPGVAGPGGNTSEFQICRTDLDFVTRGGRDRLHVVQHALRRTPEQIVDRAITHVGTRGYDLLFYNCEHFAAWCVHDRYESRQVAVACERGSAIGAKAIAASSVHLAARLGTKGLVRGVTPWMVVADALQWVTEAGGHHVGLRDPKKRRRASRAVGATTAITVGAIGGPVGMAVAGGIWCVGEVAGEVSQAVYERAREKRRMTEAR